MFVDDKRCEREAYRVFLALLVTFSATAGLILSLGY